MKFFNLRVALLLILFSVIDIPLSFAGRFDLQILKGTTLPTILVPGHYAYAFFTLTNTSGAPLEGDWVIQPSNNFQNMSVDFTPDKNYPDLCKNPLGLMPDKASCVVKVKITGPVKDGTLMVIKVNPSS